MTQADHDAQGVALRPAAETDTDVVAGIWHRGWGDGHQGHVPDELVAQRRELEQFRPLVAARIGRTTIAAVGPDTVGFVMIHDDEIEHIYVDGVARGTGVAAALLAHAEAVVAESFGVAWLAVADGNARARRFYERHGWHDAGPFDNPAPTADGGTIPVPTRRYEKRL